MKTETQGQHKNQTDEKKEGVFKKTHETHTDFYFTFQQARCSWRDFPNEESNRYHS